MILLPLSFLPSYIPIDLYYYFLPSTYILFYIDKNV